jgi:hypothetical protein
MLVLDELEDTEAVGAEKVGTMVSVSIVMSALARGFSFLPSGFLGFVSFFCVPSLFFCFSQTVAGGSIWSNEVPAVSLLLRVRTSEILAELEEFAGLEEFAELEEFNRDRSGM